MKIIKERVVERWTEYHKSFASRSGLGYTFDCDKDGNLLPGTRPLSIDNHDRLMRGEYPEMKYQGIMRFNRTYVNPAIGLCECGSEVMLRGFTNTCSKCGRDYNFNGDLLAVREQWGEETGEHISEILNIR